MTNYNFDQVFHMSITEFLTYIAYLNFDRRRQEKKLKNYKH